MAEVESEKYLGMDEDELEDEELEKLEEERRVKEESQPQPRKKGRPPKQKVAQQLPKRRYGIFSYPKREGVVDLETGEVIGESIDDKSSIAILAILADILERLERIESSIGVVLGE